MGRFFQIDDAIRIGKSMLIEAAHREKIPEAFFYLGVMARFERKNPKAFWCFERYTQCMSESSLDSFQDSVKTRNALDRGYELLKFS